jgi:hypothetical protein
MIEDPNPTPAPEPPPPSLLVRVLLLLARVTAAALLFGASYYKMTDAPAAIEVFEKLKMEPIGRYIIGGLEGLAALALLVPQSTVYGAFLGFGIMCGAVIGHLTTLGLAGLQYALLVAFCCAVVMFLGRHDAPFLDNLTDK